MKNRKEDLLPEKKLTERELLHGKLSWYQDYKFKDADEEIKPYLEEGMLPFEPGKEGWLRKARKALFYSANYVAARLDRDQQVYTSYESSEEKGTISLNTLAQAAEAMGCELVYAIRPKSRQIYSDIIWDKILAKAIRSQRLNVCDQKRLGAALAATAKALLENSEFRKLNNWSKRHN